MCVDVTERVTIGNGMKEGRRRRGETGEKGEGVTATVAVIC